MGNWGWEWHITTTDGTGPVEYKTLGDTSKLEGDIAFLREALKLAHDRIDELEGDDA